MKFNDDLILVETLFRTKKKLEKGKKNTQRKTIWLIDS